MIRCYLSNLMGQHKMKVIDVSRETGLNRSTVSALYKETAVRVDLDTVEKLCKLFDCQVSDLIEYVKESE